MLKLTNVSYVINDKKILDNINLEIDERFAVITGPNGSGKSTLAKIIAGILPVTSGKIELDGVDITNMSITDRANNGIGFAFQAPVKFKGITVKDLIAIACGKPVTVAEVCESLGDVGLCAKEYVNREVNGSLSGGELKRIEIATVIARGSKFSIFDEPEAGIDLWSFNSLIKVFEKLHEKSNGSILIISHQERILEIADKIILLSNGKIDRVDTPENVLHNIKGVVGVCPVIEESRK